MSGILLTPYRDWAKEKLGYDFDNIDLLVTALTHRSYLNEHKKSATEHNERLEFLGDAVLELVTTDFLFSNYDKPEGILTAWRSALVRTESIGAAGERLGYEKLIRMSRGEKHGSARARQQILANAFEATTGAIYLDKGYEAAKKYITDNILSTLPQILEEESWRDPKSYLQEISQAKDGFTPIYKVIKEDGPDHEKIFTLGVFVGDKKMGEGEGPSKQIAQQEAAREAIRKYKKQD
ncbi:MAG: ribonuclease III [Candidatus Nanogingivalaceae bacterium]|jgi:ribonuclease III|nr:ribonuclease III [Candidatus Nanogingivalaceae bacterium]